jgi:hypothetical protein
MTVGAYINACVSSKKPQRGAPGAHAPPSISEVGGGHQTQHSSQPSLTVDTPPPHSPTLSRPLYHLKKCSTKPHQPHCHPFNSMCQETKQLLAQATAHVPRHTYISFHRPAGDLIYYSAPSVPSPAQQLGAAHTPLHIPNMVSKTLQETLTHPPTHPQCQNIPGQHGYKRTPATLGSLRDRASSQTALQHPAVDNHTDSTHGMHATPLCRVLVASKS